MIGVPTGQGPFPVALVLHGVGLPCIGGSYGGAGPFVTGEWSPPCSTEERPYLRGAFATSAIVEELASQGIVGLAPDVNAAYFWWGGEVPESSALSALADAHLAILEDIGAGEVVIDGLDRQFTVDMERFGLIGHSRGGAFAEEQLGPDGDFIVKLSVAPSALVLVASAGAFSQPIEAVPTLNIRADCDADVGPEAGTEFTRAIAQLGGDLIVDVSLSGAGHWDMISYPIGPPSDGCAGPLEDSSVAATQTAQLAASFLSGILGEGPPALKIDSEVATVDVLRGDVALHDLEKRVYRSPPDVRVTVFADQRLEPIRADDLFLTEEELENY